MKTVNFPVTIVDNFFDYPDEIRDFGLQQEFFLDEENRWPGKRTKPLYEINSSLFQTSLNKIFSLFFNLKDTKISWVSDARFQLVDNKYKDGWIHRDENILTAIIYLSKTQNNSGTTIYSPIDPINTEIKHVDKKVESFKDFSLIEKNDGYREDNNKQFKPSVTVQGDYNRLVIFDGNLFHGANNFYGENDSSSRLTLIFFVEQIQIFGKNVFPIPRLKTTLI